MDTKFRVVALDEGKCEIGSWVFEGPRERAVRKTMDILLEHGIVPACIQAYPARDYSPAATHRY